jgi:hypothetical protein
MNTSRITVTLEREERSALMRLAEAELRDPRDQARLILRHELQQRGLLSVTDDRQDCAQTEEVDE